MNPILPREVYKLIIECVIERHIENIRPLSLVNKDFYSVVMETYPCILRMWYVAIWGYDILAQASALNVEQYKDFRPETVIFNHTAAHISMRWKVALRCTIDQYYDSEWPYRVLTGPRLHLIFAAGRLVVDMVRTPTGYYSIIPPAVGRVYSGYRPFIAAIKLVYPELEYLT